MARPPKEGLDYFPVDCYFDDKVKLIQAEFRLIGLGVLVKLWQKIYGETGYYTRWDNDVALVFASENGVGVNVVKEIVSACLRRGLFDRSMYDQYGILTSIGIQNRCADATERRKSKKIDGRYLLIAMPKNWIDVNKNPINDSNNSENVDKNEQSRGEESKVYTHTGARARGKNGNVMLTDDQYRDLCEMIPHADAYIDRFSDRILRKGYRYPDHFTAITQWWNEDKSKASLLNEKGNKSHNNSSFDTDDFFQAALKRNFEDL